MNPGAKASGFIILSNDIDVDGSPAKFRGGQGLIPNNQNRFVLLSGNAV